MTFATTNPYTGEVLKTFPEVSEAEVKEAIGRGDVAFQSWRQTSFAKRAGVMQKAADILRRVRSEPSTALSRLLSMRRGTSQR